MQAQTIDDVIRYLDEIIATSKANSSRAGYFAALYRKVTLQVKEKVQAGYFNNNPRMEKLDVVFANRYLAAFSAYQGRQQVTKSWQTAFDADPQWRPIVLQHLLVGMNAHINLDLGIAAATVAPGAELADLKDDFNKINIILASLVNDVKDELSQIWYPLRLLNWASNEEEAIINFSMKKARDEAWNFAQALAPLSKDQQNTLIYKRDQEISTFGNFVLHPLRFSQVILFIIRLTERGSVPKIISILQ